MDPKDQDVIDALVAEVVLAVNTRLEAAAVACENVGNLGEGLDYAKVVREFKNQPTTQRGQPGKSRGEPWSKWCGKKTQDSQNSNRSH